MNDAVVNDDTIHRNVKVPFPKNYISFKSKDSSVYAITPGKVTTIVSIEGMKVLIIENENKFYTYSNLGSTILKARDIVKPNQFIGFATENLDADKPTLELYLTDVKGNYIMLTKEDFIARKNKKLTDHSIDAPTPVRIQMKF